MKTKKLKLGGEAALRDLDGTVTCVSVSDGKKWVREAYDGVKPVRMVRGSFGRPA